MLSDLVADLRAVFTRVHGARGARVAVAPGRVNLIGEHTDYNDGFVLPMAVDRHVGVAFAPRDDDRILAYSAEFDEHRSTALAELEPGRHEGWLGYVAGVLWALRESGLAVRGLDLAVKGDLPIGAGLSSSAALELAVGRAACAASGIAWDATRMALLGQKAEREYVGVSCGIMDQFASSLSSEGCGLLLDCRSFETQPVPIPAGAAVVVMDTGVRRTLAGSAYNERYARCQEAVRIIREAYPDVRALRDVSVELLEEFRSRMDPVTFRRALHVVEETGRPLLMAGALRRGDLREAGRLMSDSHRSLRDLYEVSCEELDAIVELAAGHPGCYGARLTGAGFGGCAVALVDRAAAADFVETVLAGYRSRFDHPASLFTCEPVGGARLVE